ncbi:MAG TPA: hypothetical protein VFL13_06060 [Candidatus Baltobacteraceae bacterium]|nr:hypothetical protein [Candidatus Baltobacteraceae bacterium]
MRSLNLPALFGALGLTVVLASCGHSGGSALPPTAPVAPAPQLEPAPITTQSLAVPATTAFMPGSSWGRISAFQIFDETSNGYITSGAAAADGPRYSAVWGVRPGFAPAWLTNNKALRASYYFLMETDTSTTGWGAFGHSLSWWQTNHPSWILYACTSAGVPTKQPAYDVSRLPNVPLDIHNPAVVTYEMTQVASYAHRNGYTALAADEATFWFPGSGGTGYYPCGIYQGSTFVRRYSSPTDQTWAADVVAWSKIAHSTAATYGLKLIVNHPGNSLTANEMGLMANEDAVMDETGFTVYGGYIRPASFITREIAWMRYAQAHGVAVLINNDWGSATFGPAQKDYSIATYLLGNEQAASLFASTHYGYGVETFLPEYNTPIGAPCGEYYTGTSSALLYRKFANALVVVNAGGSGTLSAALPSTHAYIDLEGRAVTRPLTLAPNDGYVLKTTNGCV